MAIGGVDRYSEAGPASCDTARSAVRVLESLGFEVEIPSRPLFCGRPLYDFGMLGLARKVLRQTLDTLKPWNEAGVPIVGLEPSCITVFRDELGMLFPHDEDAKGWRRKRCC